MRQRFWRRLVAAAVGAVALAGSASAQTQTPPPPLARVAATQPAPQPMPPAAVAAAQPATGPTAPTVPAVVIPTAPTGAAVEPVPPAPGVVVAPPAGGGCNTPGYGTAARGFVMSSSGGYFGTNCSTGDRCNNGCGSCKSDAGFVLGSCKSFFSPCGPGALGCGHHGNGTLFGRCHVPVQGTGAGAPFNPCVYDIYYSHLQH